MSKPRLFRSIPFWILVVGSVASIAGGAYLLVEKLSTMTTALDAGTATGVEVYVGQIWAVLGAILVGAGVIGIALALVLGALRSLAAAPTAAAPAVEQLDEPVDSVESDFAATTDLDGSADTFDDTDFTPTAASDATREDEAAVPTR